MKALVKQGSKVAVRSWPAPRALLPGQVKVRVALAGFCRTDLYAAQGLIPTADPLVLGHEFSGLITAVGAEVDDLKIGQKTAIFPWKSCAKCAFCLMGKEHHCLHREMLGVDRAGAFAEEVVVEREMVHPLPKGVTLITGAYLEPLAAALAVTRAGLSPEQHGLVWGSHRIALLTYRVLKSKGFSNLELLPLNQTPPANTYDFIVENFASQATLQHCLGSLKPGGKLVLKSRHPQALLFQPLLAVTKEITIQAVHYGSVEEAVDLLASQDPPLDDLIGEFHPLEDWRQLFEESLEEEATKRFFLLSDEDVRAA